MPAPLLPPALRPLRPWNGSKRRARLSRPRGRVAMGERLGYVVVCFNQASGQDLASGDVLYDDAADAMGCRDDERERTALAGRRDRHVVAEVIELDGEADQFFAGRKPRPSGRG